MKHRIILADDHKIIRNGLRSLLEKEINLEVVAEAANGRQALQLSRKLKPDLVIMDISMPDLNGIDAARQIFNELPKTSIIALSMHSEKQFIEGMLRAGVSGYILKDCAYKELITAIRTVLAGKIYLSPDVAGIVVQEFLDPTMAYEGHRTTELTAREREVLQLIAEGRSTREISSLLFISIKTVETHRKNIMDKLELYTVAELTKYAIREGLTSVRG